MEVKQRNAGTAILSDKLKLSQNRRDKECYHIFMKKTIHQEDIRIIYAWAVDTDKSKFMKQT